MSGRDDVERGAASGDPDTPRRPELWPEVHTALKPYSPEESGPVFDEVGERRRLRRIDPDCRRHAVRCGSPRVKFLSTTLFDRRTRPPFPLNPSYRRRVHDQVPERPDRGHVRGSEQTVWPHKDSHLAAVAVRAVRDPTEVHDPVHGPVGDLRRPLIVEQVQRTKGERGEVRAGWGLTQIRRQPVAEGGHPGAEAGIRAVPTEELPELPPGRPERADGAGGPLRRVARGNRLHQPREVVPAARCWQRPHVLQPEVPGELVDAPGPGGVRGVREPHAWTTIQTVAYTRASPSSPVMSIPLGL